MKAIVLAAGLGHRLLPLTAKLPKPLAPIGDEPLISHLLRRLQQNGITDIVINVHHLKERLQSYLQDGQHWGVSIHYSEEQILLDTAGGIIQALPLLGPDPFLVVSGDIWTDYPFASLQDRLADNIEAHVVMVENPEFHPKGDFGLTDYGLLTIENKKLCYGNIGIYRPTFFAGYQSGHILGLGKLLHNRINHELVSGEVYQGIWDNIGTLSQLTALQQRYQTES